MHATFTSSAFSYEFRSCTSSVTLRISIWHSRPPLILVLEFFFKEKIPSTGAKGVISITFYKKIGFGAIEIFNTCSWATGMGQTFLETWAIL